MDEPKKETDLKHLISPHSISVYGEVAGHNHISDSVLLALSYNVSYQLYEILKECKIEMNVYRQNHLSSIILKNAFETCGIPPVFGHKTSVSFKNVPNSDIYIHDHPKIDLITEGANDKAEVELKPVPFVKGLYVSPLLDIISGVSNIGSIVKTEPGLDTNECHNSHISIPNNYAYTLKRKETDYFLIVSQVILNSSDNLLKILIEDLRTNPRLGGVYPTILNFIGNLIKFSSCVGKFIDRILRVIDALLSNPYFDPSSSYCADTTIDSLCVLILESKIANDCDDFPYLRRASYLLMRALNIWNITAEKRKEILIKLNGMLKSPEKMSLKLNYSVLMMFYGLGCDVLDFHFWPLLDKYLNVVSSLDEIISGKRSVSLTTEICHVKSVLLLVSGILYRNFWVQNKFVQLLHFKVDELLLTYFGETIIPMRMYAIPKLTPLFVFSTRKISQNEELVADVRTSYRKMHLFPLCKQYPTKYVPSTPTRRYDMNSIFEPNSLRKRNTRIIFNFIGSNQISHDRLRVKAFDQRYNVRCNHPSKPFLKYEKVTRYIKYCKTKPSCVGDVYLSM